jgi:prepilin-type N-terminal cleavage/methylation domain-containing protein
MKRQRAFTLIELLVVMTIVVVMVIMVWILLNPLEQIRKAQDEAKLSNGKELAQGIERYFVSLFEYPWNKRNEAFSSAVRDAERQYFYDPTLPESDFNWIWNLVDAEEIKEPAAKRIFEEKLYYVYKGNGSGQTYAWVCFEPQSVMFKQQAADACDIRRGKTNPERYRTFDPCQTDDGTVPTPESGMRNLLCVAD